MRDWQFYRGAAFTKAVSLKRAALRVWANVRAALIFQRTWWRSPAGYDVIASALVAAAYYIGAMIGLSSRFQSSPISPIWPPNTILMVALLLAPRRRWWKYLLAVCIAHLLIEAPNGVPLTTALGLYATNAGEALIGAALVLRFTRGSPWLGTMRRMAVYLASAVLVAPILTSFADAAVVVLTGWGADYWLTWETRCVSNSLSALTIGPALLLALTEARGWVRNASRWRWIEAALLTAALLLVTVGVFGGDFSWFGPPPMLVYALLPLLLWTAVRFGVGGMSFALLGITILATWYSALGLGPFSAFSPVMNAISLQLVLIAISVPMLFLAALMQEKQTTEATRQESEARFRKLADQAPALIWMSGDDMLCTFFNSTWLSFTGRAIEQEIGVGWAENVHPDDLALCLGIYQTSFAARLPFEMEYRLRRHDGVYRWMVDRGAPRYTPRGGFEGYVGLALDITDRKQAEETLRASEEQYRAMVNNFPSGIVLLFNEHLRHTFADGQGLPDIGSSKEAIEGKTLWEAFPNDLAIVLAQRYQAALAGAHAAFDLTYHSRIYQTHIQPIQYGASQAGMAVMQDVTEQRRAETLAALDQAKSAFLSNVSHELRTPLTLLLAPAADALADREAPLASRQRERLELIRRNGLRLHKLVDTLLQFSRIEAGRIHAAFELTDIATLTADVASAFRSAAEQSGLRLIVNCGAPDQPVGSALIDRDMWEQIVVNLLSNALKFTFFGEIKVALRAASDHAKWVELEVCDTGTGIPADELPHIFERFYRGQGIRGRAHEGTGIGLALVQELVRLHGGGVHVSSAPGEGTRFTVTIPRGNISPEENALGTRIPAEYPSKVSRAAAEALLHLPTSTDASSESSARSPRELPHGSLLSGDLAQVGAVNALQSARTEIEETPAPSPTGATILVADDNADMRAYLTRVLSEHWTVQAVADGAEALAAVNAQPPDLIVADVIMPELDGIALVRAIRDHSRTHSLPVILLSARAGDEATVQGLESGADDYLIKPFSARELLARVRAHIELARVRQKAAARAARLNAILEAMTDGVLVRDLSGNRIHANSAYLDMLRVYLGTDLARAEPSALYAAVGEQELQITDGQGQVVPRNEWPTQRALRGETLTGVNAVDEFGYSADGRAMQLSVTAAPVRDQNGRITGAVAVFRDVTERRRLERQVADQANQLQTIFDAMSDGVAVLDAKGVTIRANPAGRRLLGMTADDHLIGTPEKRIEKYDLRDEDGQLFTADRRPSMRILRGEVLAGSTTQTMLMRARDGNDLTISLAGAPLRDAESGQITGAVAVFRDITELKRTQAALAEERRLFRTLVENSPDIVTRFDRNLRNLYASPNSEALTGIPPSARRGKTYAELGFSEAEFGPWENALRTVLATGKPFAFESVYHPDGATPHVTRVTYAPEFASDGSVESVLGITTDITELKRIEEALRAAKTAAECAQHQELQRRSEVERRERIAESLRDVLTILNSDRQVTNVFEFISRQARRLLDCDATAIFALGSDLAPEEERGEKQKSDEGATTGSLVLRAAFGLPPALTSSRGKRRLSVGDAAVRLAMSTRQPAAIMVPSTASNEPTHLYRHSGGEARLAAPVESGSQPLEEPLTHEDSDVADFIEVRKEQLPSPYRALLAIPIIAQSHAYGSLLLLYTSPRQFSADDVALAMAYGDQIALAIANAHLQNHIEQAAKEAERNRLARELHDTVTQEIFTASVLAESIPQVWDHHRDAAEASLRQVRQLTRSALAALRALLLELRPAVLEQRTLADLLRQLGEIMTTRTGTPIDLTIDDHCPPTPLSVKVAYYRIAQEALMNAAKYANAQHINISLRYLADEGDIQLVVRDDGQGFDASAVPAGHFGLGMMRERARAAGASLRITSQRDRGTRVAVRWAPANAAKRDTSHDAPAVGASS
jgi:PAS domain S-box-containing protein